MRNLCSSHRQWLLIISIAFVFFALSVNTVTAQIVSKLPVKDVCIAGEAMELIHTNALLSPENNPGLTKNILRTYVRNIDDYSDYLSAHEYTAFLESNNSDYFGVQMDIQKKNGVIVLFPFSGGIAEKAGILPGDELMAVDGVPVYGKSVYVGGSLIRGIEGEIIQLIIRSGVGVPRSLTFHRQITRFKSVRITPLKRAYYIQVVRFVDGTDTLMSQLINTLPDKLKTIVIDLSANQGRNLLAARKCAELFLKKGEVIYSLRSRNKVEHLYAGQSKSYERRNFINSGQEHSKCCRNVHWRPD